MKYSKEVNKPLKLDKARVPRKLKKVIKEFYNLFHGFVNYSFWEGSLCTCNIDVFYKTHKNMIDNIGFYKKHKNVIFDLKEGYESTIYFDSGKLHWYWEDDNGLYSYDGIMPFAYNEEDGGNTWAFSEVANLVYYAETEMMGRKLDSGLITEEEYDEYCDNKRPFPSQIKNDISLIKYLSSLLVYKNI